MTETKSLLIGLLITLTFMLAIPPASANDPCDPGYTVCTTTSTGETIHEEEYRVVGPGDDEVLLYLLPAEVVIYNPLTGQPETIETYCLGWTDWGAGCLVDVAGPPIMGFAAPTDGDTTVTVKAYYLYVGFCAATVSGSVCADDQVPMTQVPLVEIQT